MVALDLDRNDETRYFSRPSVDQKEQLLPTYRDYDEKHPESAPLYRQHSSAPAPADETRPRRTFNKRQKLASAMLGFWIIVLSIQNFKFSENMGLSGRGCGHESAKKNWMENWDQLDEVGIAYSYFCFPLLLDDRS